MTTNKPWKDFERYVAKMFGTVRRPGSGAHGTQQGGQDDIKHPLIFAECKSLKKLLTHTLFREARKSAREDGKKYPILVMHEKGTPFKESLICCRIDDLLPLAIIRGISEDKEAERQMAENDQAPPMKEWKLKFSERFVRELMSISAVLDTDKNMLGPGVGAYQQVKGAEAAQKKFDEMFGGDIKKMQTHVDGDWNKPTAMEEDARKKKEGLNEEDE